MAKAIIAKVARDPHPNRSPAATNPTDENRASDAAYQSDRERATQLAKLGLAPDLA
jgi:hypothetical protein